MSSVYRAPDPEPCRTCWLRITQRQVEHDIDGAHAGEWRWQLLAAALCAAAAGIAHLPMKPAFSLTAFIAAYVAGSWFAAIETWEKWRQRSIDVHFLMLAVAAGAAAINQWTEGAVLLFLFSFAGGLEHFAMERTQREIRSLIHSAPKKATLLGPDGNDTEVAVESLRAGQRIRVLPGSLFPVDAEIVSGESAADESTLTGESLPIEKHAGDPVMAGTLNLWGAVVCSVARPAEQSALQRIIRLIRDAQRQKAPSQRFTDKFGSSYTLGILGLTAFMFLFWWQIGGLPAWRSEPGTPSAFYRAMTLLVVASPCALVLSIPSAILAAIASGARHGILFRGGAAVEQLASVDIVAMDKTGTLTTGDLRIEQIESFPAGRESEVLQWAYALERLSTHPLARAVTRHGKALKLPELAVEKFASISGQGLQAVYLGQHIRVGKRSWVFESEDAALIPDTATSNNSTTTASEIWVCTSVDAPGAMQALRGRLVLVDELRPLAAQTIQALKARNLRSVVLTGDRAEAAEHLRAALGVEEIRAQLHPEEKLHHIAELARQGHRVAMIGDGVNDAPSLAAAHVGVAMGARGSDAALEQADLVLMHDRLENFLIAYDLSTRARAVIFQNVALSLGVLLVLLGFALAGRIPLTVGILGHEGSTVLVVLNSLRLLIRRDTSRSTFEVKNAKAC
jgi:Cd2+/Zn2+-exporting ATPase